MVTEYAQRQCNTTYSETVYLCSSVLDADQKMEERLLLLQPDSHWSQYLIHRYRTQRQWSGNRLLIVGVPADKGYLPMPEDELLGISQICSFFCVWKGFYVPSTSYASLGITAYFPSVGRTSLRFLLRSTETTSLGQERICNPQTQRLNILTIVSQRAVWDKRFCSWWLSL